MNRHHLLLADGEPQRALHGLSVPLETLDGHTPTSTLLGPGFVDVDAAQRDADEWMSRDVTPRLRLVRGGLPERDRLGPLRPLVWVLLAWAACGLLALLVKAAVASGLAAEVLRGVGAL